MKQVIHEKDGRYKRWVNFPGVAIIRIFLYTGIMGMLFYKWHQRKAFNYFVSGKYDKAESSFLRLLEADPNKVGMRHNLALVKLALEKHGEAVKLLLDELDRFGGVYPRYRALGDSFYLWGKAAEAAGWYRKALEEGAPSKEDRSFLEKRLEICGNDQTFADAMEGIRLFNEGNKALQKGDSPAAAESYRKSAELDPTNFMTRNNLGSIYMNYEKDYPQAAEEFQAALEYSDLPLIQKNLQMCRDEERKHHEKD
ncbi:tetratricopeptide repeat protein [Marispirochaeta aestuarii]|uniref:tetratricopeptide repeat protein n=1 Tax=Marispirochaeta aestuarii TaxID=1963862 RepID=UPI002ABDCC3B|nr:tetratricopeptide repeat protein [Marispirochaeta aestuarii]